MRRALATLAIAAAGFAVAGCGKDEGDPIPQTQADSLVRSIEQVRRQSDAGSCGTLLRTTLPALEKKAQDLDPSVGSDVKNTITDGIAHLRDLATDQCTNEQQQPTTSDTTPSETSSETTPSETSDTTPPSDTSNTDTGTDTNTDTNTQSQSTGTGPPTTDTNTNTDTGGGGVTPPTTPTTPSP
jgi:hypothetical protein